MDIVSTSSEFALRFQTFMYYAGPLVNLLYWVALGVAALWAAANLHRFVALYAASRSAETPAPAVSAPAAPAEPVSVEEFVD